MKVSNVFVKPLKAHLLRMYVFFERDVLEKKFMGNK